MKYKKSFYIFFIIILNILCILNFHNVYAIDNVENFEVKKIYNTELEHTLNDGGKLTTETFDNGLVTVGVINTGDKQVEYDAIIKKFNYNGELEWQDELVGEDDDEFNSVIETYDNSLIVVGRSNARDAGFENKNGEEAIIAKYTPDGNRLWIKAFKGLGRAMFYSVDETSDKGYVAVGSEYGNSDALIVKYSENGEQEWYRTLGGSYREKFTSVIETSDGGIVAVGYFNSDDGDFELRGSTDGFIVKYNLNGDLLWSDTYSIFENPEDSEEVFFRNVFETTDNKIIVTGDTYRMYEDYEDGLILKYSQNGEMEWEKILNNKKKSEYLYASTPSDNGSFYVGLYSTKNGGTVTYIKYDSNGNELFSKEFEQKKMYYDIFHMLEDKNGDIIVTSNNKLTIYGKSAEKIAIEKAEETQSPTDIEAARDLVNALPESSKKDEFQDRLDAILPNIEFETKAATANLDVYIKSENLLSLSLNTNSVTFEDFSGVEDDEKLNAIMLTVNSSLPYDVKAYLPVEITGSKYGETLDKEIFNIRANGELDYQTFADTETPITLLSDQEAGNDNNHGIDFKLASDLAFKNDVYKATVKFEVEQK